MIRYYSNLIIIPIYIIYIQYPKWNYNIMILHGSYRQLIVIVVTVYIYVYYWYHA